MTNTDVAVTTVQFKSIVKIDYVARETRCLIHESTACRRSCLVVIITKGAGNNDFSQEVMLIEKQYWLLRDTVSING